VSFTVNVTSASGTPTGDISLIAQTSSTQSTGIGSFTLGSGGSLTGTTDMLPGGSYNVVAHYAGDGIYGASDSAPQAVTVGKESSLTKVGVVSCDYTSGICTYGVTNLLFGSASAALRVDVTNASGQPCASPTTALISYPCPSGTVTATVNGQAPIDSGNPSGSVPGTYLLNSQGYVEDQFVQLPAGTYNIAASYAGDNSYTASPSTPVPITITKAPTTTTITNVPQTLLAGRATQVTVTVNTQSHGLGPQGVVQYLLGGTPQLAGGGSPQNGTASTYASLQATWPIFFAGGANTLTAKFSGDNYYAPSESAPVIVTAPDFTLSSTPATINIPAAGQTATATITLASVSGFSGTVSLYTTAACFVGATCTLSPSSVVVTGTSAGQSTLTITTTAPSSAPPHGRQSPPAGFRMLAGWRWLVVAMLALAMLLTLATMRRTPAGWSLVATLMVVGVWVACGGASGGGGGSTPPSSSGPTAALASLISSYGQQVVNTPSLRQGASFINTGNLEVNISSISITGANPADFSQTNDCGSSLAASAHCDIYVIFTPTAIGTRNATLTVIDDASGSPHTASLTGIGTPPLVSITPTSLTFGQQIENTQSAPQTLTLTNTGSAPISFYPMNLQGGNYGDFLVGTNTCGVNVNLAAGANCTVGVIFRPLGTGARSSLFVVVLNGNPSQQTLGLNGTGVLPPTPPGTYSVDVEGSSSGDMHDLRVPVVVP
jgi:hypothetical protein